MKTYQVSRAFVRTRTALTLAVTGVGALLYYQAVTHPTPLPLRLMLLAGLYIAGWLVYFRLPRVPTEIAVSDDGWVDFRGRRGTTRVHVAAINSIARGLRRSVRVRHAGGRVRLPNRFQGFYDFLATVKGMNPGIEIRGF